MSKNSNLTKAKSVKNDEFYTRLEDIEAEISCHPDYVRHFKDKVVFCNCDDPEQSNFFVFFRLHFKQLGLKKLITTHYNKDGSPSYKIEWSGEMLGEDTINMITTPLKGNGDFRSEECIELMKEADVIVTNPPFSLFLVYLELLLKYHKKFIILGNRNSLGNNRIFDLFRQNKIWTGYSTTHHMLFAIPDECAKAIRCDPSRKEGHGQSYSIIDGKVYAEVNACWYTNVKIDKLNEPMILTRNYVGNENRYPKYDNYDAIECSTTKNLPKDFFDVIGVPITFLEKYVPSQFEIIGKANSNGNAVLNGKNLYTRILIRRIQNQADS